MGNSQQVSNPTNDANTAITLYGALDAGLDVAGNQPGWMGAASGALGAVGGGLAAFGLGWDIADIATNGLGVDNGLSAAGNAMGTGSFLASVGAFGTGATATAAAPLLAAGAGGLAVGGIMNSIADSDYNLFQDEQGRGTDDRWQQAIIDNAIANGEDPSSLGNVVLGGLAGTAGQLVDVAGGIGGGIAAGASAAWSAVTSW